MCLDVPSTSRGVERLFSSWDRYYRKNVFTGSAYIERALFCKQFKYGFILEALRDRPFLAPIADFVKSLRDRPKYRKEALCIAWKEQHQLNILANEKFHLKSASDSLLRLLPQQLLPVTKGKKLQLTKQICLSLLEKITKTSLSKSEANKITFPILRSTTLLLANNLEMLFLSNIQVTLLKKTLPHEQHLLYHLATSNDSHQAIAEYKQQYLALGYQNHEEVDVTEERQYTVEKILGWNGEQSKYELTWKGWKKRHFEPGESLDMGGGVDKLISFWEQIDEVMILGDRGDNDFMEEDVLLITEKESTEIQGQLQPDKSEEIKNKIQEIERQGGKICHCVKYKFQVEGGDNLK